MSVEGFPRPSAWRKKVTDRALTEARGCLRDRDDGRESAREIKAMAETIISPELYSVSNR